MDFPRTDKVHLSVHLHLSIRHVGTVHKMCIRDRNGVLSEATLYRVDDGIDDLTMVDRMQ